MIINKKWEEMTHEERLKVVDPILNHLKDILLSDKSLSFSFAANYETPEIRNGIGERVKIPYATTDEFIFEITRMKST